ncbi:melanopsin-B-like [Mercenaria mercenaria]|uniref:melanopsin-B-like n=1 Tax=Mercenaria mercenaria TaxID=6596 RepID=UPI00234F23D8|nr:melanopsin-B-like [Mercenaria mercenaria]
MINTNVLAMLATNNSSDIESQLEQHQSPLSRPVCIILGFVLILAFIIGTIGNITVLALFVRYKSLRSVSNIFVINLTIADLMMCLCLPVLINDYFRGHAENDIVCKINTFLGAFTGFLSIWSLVCLAFDRCIVISRSLPVRHSSDKAIATYIIISIWFCCLLAAAVPFFGYGRYVLEGQTTSCEKKDNFTVSFSNMFYNIMIQILFFFIPVCCITSCYICIFITVRNHETIYFKTRKSGQYNEVSFRRMRKSRKLEQNEMKTARAGIILISVFCLSWVPFSIVSWIGLFGNRDTLTPIAVALPSIFAKISTILNPLLYALLLPSFRAKLKFTCNNYFKPASLSYGSTERSIPGTVCYMTHSQRLKTCIVFAQRE